MPSAFLLPVKVKCMEGGQSVRMTAQKWDELQSVNIGAVAADDLPDMSSLVFDKALSREERLTRPLHRGLNPYCFSVGGVGVKLEFTENGPTLQNTLTGFFIQQKSGL